MTKEKHRLTLMNRLGIELISVLGMNPVATVELAADLGLSHIKVAFSSLPFDCGYPPFSLRKDASLRRELIAVCRDRGIFISLGDGFQIRAGMDVRTYYPEHLEIMAELGVKNVNALIVDKDLGHGFDQFAVLAEMVAAHGMETVIEFIPIFGVCNLETAAAAVRHVGRRDTRILIDTMHAGRSGMRAADLKALDPDMIGHVQLCDAPKVPTIDDYMEEACFERMVPGTGELPLFDYLAAIRRDIPIGVEVPQRAEARAGIGPHERFGKAVAGARELLKRVEAQ
jgi:sugar phosphate isomerase/epimerase